MIEKIVIITELNLPILLRLGVDDTVAVLSENGEKAWYPLFKYNDATRTIATDPGLFNDFVDFGYAQNRKSHKIISGSVNFLTSAIIFVAEVITSILGSIWGIGIAGFVLVMFLTAMQIMAWFYAFLLIGPLLLINLGMKHEKQNTANMIRKQLIDEISLLLNQREAKLHHKNNMNININFDAHLNS